MRYWRAVPALLALATGCAVPLEDETPAGDGLATLESSVTWEPCTAKARMLRDIQPGAPGSLPESLVKGADGLFFTADDGVHGRELWVSSGTGGTGTFLVKDVRPGLDSAEPNELTVVGDRVFFTADDGVHGRELWVSDGTATGTSLVKDIHASPLEIGPSGLVEFDGRVYFAANDGVHGRELWVSDGTEAGTFMVEDLYPGGDIFDPDSPGSSSPRRMTRTPNAFYFVANVGRDVKLWRSEGEPGATPVFEAFEDNVIFRMTPVGSGQLFFLVDNDEGEASLWVTRGTLGSTRRLRFFHGAYPHDLTALNGKLYFSAGRGSDGLEGEPEGEELWVSDGTTRGTRVLEDIHRGAGDSRPGSLTVMNRRLFFAADDGRRGRELWVSDGTSGGTRLFKDLEPGAAGASPTELTAIQDTLFFSAETAEKGREAWVSDGTSRGTRALTELAPGPTGSDPSDFIRSGWDVFFSADDGEHGRELWALPFRPEGHCGR
ncbi:MAG TPA: ELWxxDGT repeat protein [Archangium sp.]|uniref:ELWxxDGT repeat protein n=1 Tax=Archangium sp. TaxID=1872627 RepID=UPI002E34CB26|nr:ELWxxDGT repeat protein [Archangium sp.]HEX5747794.1 ELWxxDGT repeat protein [Archangium sp.]